jgi:hypothetical protein
VFPFIVNALPRYNALVAGLGFGAVSIIPAGVYVTTALQSGLAAVFAATAPVAAAVAVPATAAAYGGGMLACNVTASWAPTRVTGLVPGTVVTVAVTVTAGAVYATAGTGPPPLPLAPPLASEILARPALRVHMYAATIAACARAPSSGAASSS